MALPMPTLDHVVINVRDRLDEALETYRRLGFTMTPRGYHTLGSMNHLAIFGTEYLELIAARPGDGGRPEIMASSLGLDGLVFGTEDSAAVFAALQAAGIPVQPPLQFSRPVELPGGPRDATFRTVRLTPGITEAGRLYFCHHFTRDLVWRDEWRHHTNGAIGVIRAVIAAPDPTHLGNLFAGMFGADAMRPLTAGCSLLLGLSRFDVITPAALRAQFGAAAATGDGRGEFMAALTIRVRSLDHAFSVLKGSDAVREGHRIVVPAGAAFGVTLEFCD
jgi:hypothetical protein